MSFMIEVIKNTILYGGLAAVLLIPFYQVYRGDSFKKGVFTTWGLYILWATILSLPVYDFLWWYNPELTNNLPEGNSIVGALFVGWIPGIIVAVFAQMIRYFVNKYKRRIRKS